MLLVIVVVTFSALFVVPTRSVKADTGDYPYATYNGPGSDPSHWVWTDSAGNMWSPYHYAYRNCTDFVAWKLTTANSWNPNLSMGNADSWKSWASNPSHSYSVNSTPAVGSVAWWGDHSWNGNFGHVAYVLSVSGDGTQLTVGEYNFSSPGNYDTRTIAVTSAPTGYIHFHDLTSSTGSGSVDVDGYFHGTPPNGAVIENHDGGLHKYVALGGSLFWIPEDGSIWDYVNQMTNLFPTGTFHNIVWMHDSDIHNIEFGYPSVGKVVVGFPRQLPYTVIAGGFFFVASRTAWRQSCSVTAISATFLPMRMA